MIEKIRKLFKTEPEQIINSRFNESHYIISISPILKDKDILRYYHTQFEAFDNENIATYDNNELSIPHQNLYELLNDDRSSLLNLPKLFDGELEVSHRGNLQGDASFEISFKQNHETLFGVKVVGSILKLTSTNFFLLPKEMYEALQLLNLAIQSNKVYDRYVAIGYIQGVDSDKIAYAGLRENDLITTVNGVGIDIIEQEDGSLRISPLISGLDHDYLDHHKNEIVSHQEDNLLLARVYDGQITRYAWSEKKLSGAKKIFKTERIPASQAKAFKENPEAFLPEYEKDEIDLELGYRIKGYTTEPYVGFFGSENLETPMSLVLSAGKDIAISLMKDLKTSLNGLREEERDSLKIALSQAKENGEENFRINESDFPIDTVQKILSDISSENVNNELPETPKQIKSYTLQIDPNDENSVEILTESKVTLEEINISNNKTPSDWSNFRFEPFPHQIVGMNWMRSLYQLNFSGGLLADDMGLGKTYQIIAFINYLFHKQIMKDKRVLIVAPTTLLSNWKNEFDNIIIDNTNFKIRIIQGRNEALNRILNTVKDNIESNSTFDLSTIQNNDNHIINLLKDNIYLTTYETLSNYQLVFSQQHIFNFELCVYDEAQKIKNPNARISIAAKGISSNIPFSIAVTGTPIENELRDIWSLFDTFDPSFIGSWKSFRENYVKPLSHGDVESVNLGLRNKISNYMLRRMKQDHLDGLPNKIYKKIEVAMSEKEERQHRDVLSSEQHPMEKLQTLRLLSLHPKLLNSEKEMSVDSIKAITEAKHFFKPSKMVALKKLLDEIKSKNEKVLIFIIRYSMQTLLKYALDEIYQLNTTIINGKNNKRDYVNSKLDTFQSNKGFDVMILSPLAAGVGLTITAANHVIHLERHWNPAKEDQASDRAYRIGQKKDVTIYHLIHRSNNEILTFDAGLEQLMNNKRSLSDGTLIPTPSIKESEVTQSFFGHSSNDDSLQYLSPDEFEQLIFSIYQNKGYLCNFTSKQPTESGADIIGVKDGEQVVIQCKHTTKNTKQGREAIRQLVTEAMPEYPNATFIAATNFYFNTNAKELAKKHSIQLIEKDELIENISG